MVGLKRCWAALKERRSDLAWSIVSGLLGAGIGLLAVTLWGHTVGW